MITVERALVSFCTLLFVVFSNSQRLQANLYFANGCYLDMTCLASRLIFQTWNLSGLILWSAICSVSRSGLQRQPVESCVWPRLQREIKDKRSWWTQRAETALSFIVLFPLRPRPDSNRMALPTLEYFSITHRLSRVSGRAGNTTSSRRQ